MTASIVFKETSLGTPNRFNAMSYNWDRILRICAGDSAHAMQMLAGADLPLEDLLRGAPLPVDGNPYGRIVLHANDLGEILLVRWRPGAFCAPHDHGASSGFVRLLHGSFIERAWKMIDGDLVLTSERSISAPEIATISRNSIHSIRSVDGGVSLHCYVPPVSAMRVYDRSSKATLTLADDCGAWIPADSAQILSRESWAEGVISI